MLRPPIQRVVLHSYGAAVRICVPFAKRLTTNPDVTWLFIACLPNGGSTALAKMLRNASAAHTLTPSGEGQWLVPAMSQNGRRWDPNLPLDYAQIRRVWLSRLVLRRKPCVVIEKSPPNLCRFHPLLASFEGMPRITLVVARNPFAICASWAKRYKPSTVIRTWHPELAGRGLETDDLLFHEALGSICGKRFEMLAEAAKGAEYVTTYETIAENPTAFLSTMGELTPLLKDADPSALLGVKDYPAQPFNNMNEADIARLTSAQSDAIRQGLAPYEAALTAFGYTIAGKPI